MINNEYTLIGYGDGNSTPVTACTAPDGYVSDNTDCDDSEPLVNPSEVEVCDLIDNDCDGDIDDEDSNLNEESAIVFYLDGDGDGFGRDSDTASVAKCVQPEGYVDNANDCDDQSTISYPEADEVCDELDNDCDGLIDEDLNPHDKKIESFILNQVQTSLKRLNINIIRPKKLLLLNFAKQSSPFSVFNLRD